MTSSQKLERNRALIKIAYEEMRKSKQTHSRFYNSSLNSTKKDSVLYSNRNQSEEDASNCLWNRHLAEPAV
jgi:hypothetical protein